jgi:hypothetical protein
MFFAARHWDFLLIFSCCIYYCNSETIHETYVITVDGRRVLFEDITLAYCSPNQVFCSCDWTDSFGVPIVIGNITRNWRHRPEEWKSRSIHGPFEIADGINHVIHLIESDSGSISENSAPTAGILNAADECSLTIAIPLFLLSDPERTDKRENSLRLLRSAGFYGNISFLPFTEASTVDIQQLIRDEVIDQAAIDRMLTSGWIGKRALTSYIANAIDNLAAVRSGADSGFELFGIFEDDLMLAGSPETIRMRLTHALQNFPPTADMLYLEACHETCSERKFSYHYPLWARTTGPSCNAAIIFTKKGARRISLICRSIFWGSDNMYASMIRAGLLEAYVITPTVFLQDGYWQSSLQVLRGSENMRKLGDRAVPGVTHRPYSYLCKELDNELRLVHVQVSEETSFLRNCFASTYLTTTPSKVLFVSDSLSNKSALSLENTNIDYFMKDHQNSWIQVGHWPQEYGVHGVVLWIDTRSVCFELITNGVCNLKVLLNEMSEDDFHKSPVETVLHVPVGELLVVHQTVNGQDDIFLTSFRSTKEGC